MLRVGVHSLAMLALVFVAAGCNALGPQTPAYPTRDITLISGFAPGGTTDLVGRMAADYLGKKWHVTINVVNKPGGNTVPANVDLYNAAPDGYTLMADSIGSSSTLPSTDSNLPFKVVDRTFVAMISSNSMLIFVPPNSPIQSLKDAAEDAKKDPPSFTWTGVGVAEIPVRQLFSTAGVDVTKTKPVVSSGSVSGATLAAQGSVKLGVAAVGSTIPMVTGGLVKPLAIAAEKRWAALPDVPTTVESGYPNVNVVSWIGITGPPKLPANVVDQWNSGIKEMLADPAIQDQLTKFASVPDYRDPKAFKDEVEKEVNEIDTLWQSK